MTLSDKRSGALRERLEWQRRGDGDDGFGNTLPGVGPFETQFTTDAAIAPSGAGDEVAQGARFEGIQPFTVTVRYFPSIENVTTAWRLVDARNEYRQFAIKAVTFDAKRQWVEALVIEGEVT